MRVLLVEDDRDLAHVVLMGLRQEHLAVDHAATFAEATELALVTAYDIVCLDLGLPDGDGIDLCRHLRAGQAAPGPPLMRPRRILMLTARDAVTDRVTGLDAGADDYLIKPFTIAELTARIRALGRRGDQPGGPLTVNDLIVDPVSHRAERSGRQLELTSREFAVLRHFAMRPGEVISGEQLLEHCWDTHADAFTGSVRVILSRLRRKIGDPPMITTIKGVGYRMDAVS